MIDNLSESEECLELDLIKRLYLGKLFVNNVFLLQPEMIVWRWGCWVIENLRLQSGVNKCVLSNPTVYTTHSKVNQYFISIIQ